MSGGLARNALLSELRLLYIRYIMTGDLNLIWYASYGSNTNLERFLCYIRGGQPNGATKNYVGCTDRTLPRDSEELYICSELYFAQSSKTWENCGVGFLRNEFNEKTQTWARMYLITQEQFIQVAEQEMGNKTISIDFERAQKEDYVFAPGSWYGKIIYLGDQNWRF